LSETTSETRLSAGWALSSPPSGHDVQDEDGDDDDRRRDGDDSDRGGGHNHVAILSPPPARETLNRERSGSCSRECRGEHGEAGEVGVQLNPHQPATRSGFKP
jgi:hypothetical protein